MDPVTSPAAPAPPAPAEPAAPATVSATRAASEKGDFAAFDKAEIAARVGKPDPEVKVPAAPAAKVDAAVPAPDATAEPGSDEPSGQTDAQGRPISKRQQRINETIRAAVDRETATLREENARLKALPRSEAPPAAPTNPPPAPTADAPKTSAARFKDAAARYAQHPDFPKLEEFDSVGEHSAAVGLFISEQLQQESSKKSEGEQLTTAQRARVDTFVGRLNETKTADPDFVNKLTPEVKALKPFSALAPGEAGGPLNVLTEQIYDSPIAPQVLLHLSQHPDVLQKFQTMPPEIAALPPALRTRAHTAWIVKEFGKLEGSLESTAAPAAAAPAPAAPSIVSQAPPPAPVHRRAGSSADSKEAALERGDFATFDRLETADRVRQMTRT